jgi:SAM-dependent methyltransferase
MMINFYDKVAKKFGGYAFGSSHVRPYTEYPDGDPEKEFKEKLLRLVGKKIHVLDAGCGDGKFAFENAQYFFHTTGIDVSKGLLKVAGEKQKILHVKNITFKCEDARKTSFPDASFDVIFSRRGPTPYGEFYRLLKPGGHFVGINIGEKDCQEIKVLFGRGQGYGEWNSSKLETDKEVLINAGFKIIFAKDYFCDEYYGSYEELDFFLQGVPIFEDFDSKKDESLLRQYERTFKTEKGIRLPRHRVVIVARK